MDCRVARRHDKKTKKADAKIWPAARSERSRPTPFARVARILVEQDGDQSQGLEGWLTGIREDLRAKTYQPQAVRRVMIPKSGGGERPLGTLTIRDRVAQTAAKLLLEPTFEADF